MYYKGAQMAAVGCTSLISIMEVSFALLKQQRQRGTGG